MNQHDFVRGCLAFYEEDCLTPEKGWEEAHYPDPKGKGVATIWLQHEDHQIQGLWQSKEYGQCCFFTGDALEFLTKGPFVSGWFELWDIYDKYSTLQSSAAGRKGGTKAAELGLGIHGRTPEQITEDSRKGGKIGGKTTTSQKWQSTNPNHPPHISNSGGLSRWQKARGIDTSLRVKLQ